MDPISKVLADRNRIEKLHRLQRKLQEGQRKLAVDPGPLPDFIRRISGPKPGEAYSTPPHILKICEVIERAERGEVVRVCISLPIRHGKSSTTHAGIVWYLLKHPTRDVGYVSYNIDFATKQSRDILKIAQKAGLELAEDKQGEKAWETLAGGHFTPTGIGGGITGRGFNLLIVDDPVKDQAEADSEIMRETVWDWFNGTAYGRLEPGASCIVVMSRWHEDDLVGRLIAQTDPKWEYLHIPAVSDAGEALWPDRFPISALEGARKQVGERKFNAQFQGRPRAAEGAMFKDHWMKVRYTVAPVLPWQPRPQDSAVPVLEHVVQAVDSSWKTGSNHDFSVIATWGLHQNSYWLLDVYRARVEYPDLERMVISKAAEYRPNAVLIEDSASGKAIIQSLRRCTKIPIIPINATASKESRAQSIAPIFESLRVKLPQNADWLQPWIEEHCAFPTGRHDDQVDTTSMALRRLAGLSSGQILDIDAFRGRRSAVPSSIFGR